MNRQRWPRPLLAGLMVLMLGACGQSSSSGASAGTGGFTAAELCSLVTPAEVGAALGVSVGAGVPSGVNAPSCSWQAADGSGATIAGTDPGGVGKMPFGMQGMTNSRLTAVSGIGDACYIASAGTLPNADLSFKKGGKAVDVTAASVGFTQAQQAAAEIAIATAAAKRF